MHQRLFTPFKIFALLDSIQLSGLTVINVGNTLKNNQVI
jgi:hypothetical protein